MATAQAPHQWYTSTGKKTKFKKVLKHAEKSDIVYFGELHNNAIAHWLQLELVKALQEKGQMLVLGAEMFETDNQLGVNAFLSGEIEADSLGQQVRLWPNHKTDYQPLLDVAKQHGFPFVATNIPRRYASQVFRQGIESLDQLTEEEKAWIVPLPMKYDAALPGYQAMLDMMSGGHGGDNFPKAQAIKDATMAHFLLKHLQSDAIFVHFNGSYHSDNHSKAAVDQPGDGIPWYIHQDRPELKQLIITTITQADLSNLAEEHLHKADFILVVDEDVPTTY